MSKFETLGYHMDYLVDGKYMGSEPCELPEGRELGYNGRETFILQEEKKLKRKTIKAGTKVTTEIFPLNGRAKK